METGTLFFLRLFFGLLSGIWAAWTFVLWYYNDGEKAIWFCAGGLLVSGSTSLMLAFMKPRQH